MPKFPRYESQRELTTQQPSFLPPESTEGQRTELLSKALGDTATVSAKIFEGISEAQKQTATRNYEFQEADLLSRMQQDPNPDYDRYSTELDKLALDSVKDIKSPLTRNLATKELSHKANLSKIKARDFVYKHAIDTGRASVLDRLSGFSGQGDIAGINSLIKEQESSNLFSREDLQKMGEKYRKDAKQNQFMYDLGVSPTLADEKLTANEYGFDIKELGVAKDIYREEFKKIQAVTENEMIGAYLNGEDISPEEVKQLMKNGKVDAQFAESMINKLNNPKPDKFSQDATYIDFQNRVMDLDAKGDRASTEEIVKLMSDTIKAHSDGLLDKADVQRILKDRNELVQKKLDRSSDDVMSKVRPKNWLQKLSFWSDEYADKKPEIKSRMYRKLLDGLTQGQEGESLMRKIINDEIEIQLADNLAKSDRMTAINPESGQKIYSDDGGATWKDESGKEVK